MVPVVDASADGPDCLASESQHRLASEHDFYSRYRWALNPFPNFTELLGHLRSELANLDSDSIARLEGWQRDEVMTNVYLLACLVSNSVDDFLLGEQFDFSKITQLLPPTRVFIKALENGLHEIAKFRSLRLRGIQRWRERWELAVVAFLRNLVAPGSSDPAAFRESRDQLVALINAGFPASIGIPQIPSVFRSKDLTHQDFLALGRKLIAEVPDRRQPILLIGIRSAGSYFSPLVHALLAVEGYKDLEWMTIRPKRGLTPWENFKVRRGVERGALAVILDESAATGSTFSRTVRLLGRAGFAEEKIIMLMPIHPAGRDWASRLQAMNLQKIRTLTIEPEEWHKSRLLEPRQVEHLVQEYFRARGYSTAKIIETPRIERMNAALQDPATQDWSTRLKRAYEVRLTRPGGQADTKFVFVKSVGWGWLGYHGYIVGDRLARFVPPMLGLRDGILFSECILQEVDRPLTRETRGRVIRAIASYVVARVRELHLESDPSSLLWRDNRDNGLDRLAGLLSKAYGTRAAGLLKRVRLRQKLHSITNQFPTLIDGQMWEREWIAGPDQPLKTDYAHHGMGKYQHNLVDPAYDLADAILDFRFTPSEERQLLDEYIAGTGDARVAERLFFYKLLAGNWAMAAAYGILHNPRVSQQQHREASQRFLDSRDFLIKETTRHCGSLCFRRELLEWHDPLVVLDIDGVIDRNVFGFPGTTAAGIQAISLLNAHGFGLALNTARNIEEVQTYCEAYGCLGGVAEYGSAVWDAVKQRMKVLVSTQSLAQIQELRSALEKIPGIFLNDRYPYTIRAITYSGERTAPLPRQLIDELITELRLDRLRVIQNETDTTILAREVNKGSGLLALLDFVGLTGHAVCAIGDTGPDLPMFQVAERSFAPAQINCREAARALGCRISSRAYQLGLLEIARELAHPGGGHCDRCRAARNSWPRKKNLFVELLERADQKPIILFLRAILDPLSFRTFEA